VASSDPERNADAIALLGFLGVFLAVVFGAVLPLFEPWLELFVGDLDAPVSSPLALLGFLVVAAVPLVLAVFAAGFLSAILVRPWVPYQTALKWATFGPRAPVVTAAFERFLGRLYGRDSG
jgi:hypothetical protein